MPVMLTRKSSSHSSSVVSTTDGPCTSSMPALFERTSIRPNRLDDLAHDLVDGGPVGQVEGEGQRPAPGRLLDLRARLLDVLGRPGRDDDLGALLGEANADGAADPRAGAGHERHLVRRHGRPHVPRLVVTPGSSFLGERGSPGCSTASQSVNR